MIYQSQAGDIRMVLVGDAMPSRSLRPFSEPDYLKLLALIRGADVSFANLETTVREREEGTPMFTTGTPMTTPPALLGDLTWMGFDILATANNHATDYGVGGVMATVNHLRRANIPFAGSGASLADACAPGYIDTAAGRVALLACNSLFNPSDRAADPRPDAHGRPGVNALGFSTEYTLDGEGFAALRRINEETGHAALQARRRSMFFSAKEAPADTADTLMFHGTKFRRGDGFAISTGVNQRDAEANLRWIREARRQADWVIFSFHYHEFGSAGARAARNNTELEEPAAFAVDFARAAIEAGADVVAGHGPHVTLGVEVHKGKPILYSLGNFIFQNDTVRSFPHEAYGRFDLGVDATPADFLDARTGKDTRGFPASCEFWESVVGECEFRGGKLVAIRVHPVDLGHGLSRPQRGRPVMARGAVAARILERVRRLSQRFGTRIEIEGDVGVVRVG
jgi:poly-gamma-glutamate synthesis protein (capsule biosynthesis protein)